MKVTLPVGLPLLSLTNSHVPSPSTNTLSVLGSDVFGLINLMVFASTLLSFATTSTVTGCPNSPGTRSAVVCAGYSTATAVGDN